MTTIPIVIATEIPEATTVEITRLQTIPVADPIGGVTTKKHVNTQISIINLIFLIQMSVKRSFFFTMQTHSQKTTAHLQK